MKGARWKLSVSRVYDQVHLALWAALAGSIIFFAVCIAPQIKAYQANYAAARQTEIESEDDFYCKRLGIRPEASNYTRCMTELLQFRRSIEKQIADSELP